MRCTSGDALTKIDQKFQSSLVPKFLGSYSVSFPSMKTSNSEGLRYLRSVLGTGILLSCRLECLNSDPEFAARREQLKRKEEIGNAPPEHAI